MNSRCEMVEFEGFCVEDATLRGTAAISEGVIAVLRECALGPPVSTLHERLPGGGNLNEESDDESILALNGGTAALFPAANVVLARWIETQSSTEPDSLSERP
jgi:hypothetical protein